MTYSLGKLYYINNKLYTPAIHGNLIPIETGYNYLKQFDYLDTTYMHSGSFLFFDNGKLSLSYTNLFELNAFDDVVINPLTDGDTINYTSSFIWESSPPTPPSLHQLDDTSFTPNLGTDKYAPTYISSSNLWVLYPTAQRYLSLDDVRSLALEQNYVSTVSQGRFITSSLSIGADTSPTLANDLNCNGLDIYNTQTKLSTDINWNLSTTGNLVVDCSSSDLITIKLLYPGNLSYNLLTLLNTTTNTQLKFITDLNIYYSNGITPNFKNNKQQTLVLTVQSNKIIITHKQVSLCS